MRSRIISLVLIVMLLLIAVPSASQAQDVVTLKYHTWFPPQSALQPVIDQFEKDNPNIKVELDVQDVCGGGSGACLVELYTGLVYEGPDLVGRIKQGLLELLQRDGLNSIAEAVGIAAPARASEPS